jgi:molybdopterin-containing oxidoreductase family membrane subunit
VASNLDGMQVWRHIVAGPVFWIGLGLLVAALVMGVSGAGSLRLAGLLALLGLFIGKYEFVIGGQLVPLFKGSQVHGLIRYTPSAAEWALLAMSLLLALAVYAFGAARFGLDRR